MIEPANTIFNSASNASSQEMKFGASIRAIGVTKIYGNDQDAFHALGSGPARTSGSNEPLFDELKYHDSTSKTCIVIEVDRIPPVELTSKIAKMCNVQNNELTVILTPTSSLAGTVQIISRVLETSLHKAHELHFPLENIIDGAGSAPLCPPSNDFLTAMSRTND